MTQWLEETREGVFDPTRTGATDDRGTSGSGSFLRPGEVFGPWSLVEHIADGGFGSVWRAAAVTPVRTEWRTVGVGENAAVKFFAATTEDHRRRIVREVALARRLGGHWTPEYYGSDLDAIPQWAAFELVTDATLRDLVRSTGPLTGESLEVFAEDLWDALAFFRRHRVAHRDLTPANVHVHGRSAKPRVVDWGNARDASDGTHTPHLPRTAGYAAPEQVEGRPAGPAADLWSWAAVVCFAATGHPPLPVDGYHQAIITCELPLDLDGVPARLLPALDAALRWDPADRDPDVIAGHLPGRQAHVQLEAARARQADLDEALDDLHRRMRLRDERIEELVGLTDRYETERRELVEMAERLVAAETERDDAAREATALRARVAELENELDRVRATEATVADATAALRRARIDAYRDRFAFERLRWRNARLERRLRSLGERRHRVATAVPVRVAAALTVAVFVLALVRATWEAVWLPALFLLPGVVGVAVTTRVTARSRRGLDRARAGALAAAVVLPFLAPLLFSAGAVPSPPLARWVIEAPFVTPPPPDSVGVGHGAMDDDVDPSDCTAPLPAHSYWDVLVMECRR